MVFQEQFSAASERYDQVFSLDRYARNTILVNWVGRDKRVLELGCSTGYISRLLSEQGCCVTGVEVDASAAGSAGRWCEQIVTADVNIAGWDRDIKGKYDVVLLGDVLEHLIHPDRVLRDLSRKLVPTGYAVISLPNVVHWRTRLQILGGQFDYQTDGTLDKTHLRFFTLKSAHQLIESSGYCVNRFHPCIGGRGGKSLRTVLHWAASMAPGPFAYQMLFMASPVKEIGA